MWWILFTVVALILSIKMMRFGKQMQRQAHSDYLRQMQIQNSMIQSAIKMIREFKSAERQAIEEWVMTDEQRKESVLEDFKEMLYG